jgi:hypothetical protein
MDRQVPSSANNAIALYTRTYYSLLRSSREIKIRTLIEAHLRIQSALHVHANSTLPDLAAFIYTIQRLPAVILNGVRLVVLGLSEQAFATNGYADIEVWDEVTTPARRRRTFYNGSDTLAVYIASRSDIDDLIPMLTAFQIERDKLHNLLKRPIVLSWLETHPQHSLQTERMTQLAELSGIALDDLERLGRIWQGGLVKNLLAIAQTPVSLSLRNLAGSLTDYRRATHQWWRHVESVLAEQGLALAERPIYFVSSNTHSIANLLSGFALQHKTDLAHFIQTSAEADLQAEFAHLQGHGGTGELENFYYYSLKKLEAKQPAMIEIREQFERALGIYRVPSEHLFDVEVQVIDLARLKPQVLDPRLQLPNLADLRASQALLINIDFPLGMAAYQILSEISRNVASIRGVYIVGKAASLNGRIGDVMLPTVVHDEHSHNTYFFENCIRAGDVYPYLLHGDLLDNQKAITVLGTFLQNSDFMSVFYEEGYTDMEMEAGPYLNCVYEMLRPKRYPENEIINLTGLPFPVGLVHYASDTPLSKGKNLGHNLSYLGIDATYASSIAVLRHILQGEQAKWLNTVP